MFQRIEKLRKNAFASMCVFCENNNNTIAGVWFWKGQELAFPVSFLFKNILLIRFYFNLK
jgi:elongation factor 1-gamma